MNWAGNEDRRSRDRRANSCGECERIGNLEVRVDECKDSIDAEIRNIHVSVGALSQEVHGLRGDVHQMTSSVASIKDSLATIANTMSKLADWPDTWTRIQGFWSVVRWMRDNFLLIVVLLAMLGYAGYFSLLATGAFK